MDRGARIAWPQRHNEGELSALQHAQNLRFRDEAAFFAECQNEPVRTEDAALEIPTPAAITGKISGLARGRLPTEAELLTLFVDVHDSLLYWLLTAWSPTMRGWVVDYGTYPDQRRLYFTMRQATRTLRRAHQGTDTEGAIFAGLVALLDRDLLCRQWKREDGAEMELTRCLVDVGYKPDTVADYMRQSPSRALLFPSRGQGITAGQKPIYDYDRKRGDRIGHYWWIPKADRRRASRHLRIDTNYWKTFAIEGLADARGSRRSIDLYGKDPGQHRLLADHLTAETATETEGHGRTVQQWHLIPGRDNHWLDCLVGTAAAASLHGAAPGPTSTKRKPTTTPRRRKRVAYLST
jgi:phage terminase large subunit GpA-like protein